MKNNSEIKILLVSSDKVFAEGLIESIKTLDIHIIYKTNIKELLSIQDITFDTIILGIDILKDSLEELLLRFPLIPLIVLLDEYNRDGIIQVLKSGATGYLIKKNLGVSKFEKTILFSIARNKGLALTNRKISTMTRRYQLLKSVFNILLRKDLSFSQQINEILKTGAELFDEDIGIVSQIVKDRYTVKYVYTANKSIEAGQVFDLKETFCSITINANSSLGINDLISSPYKNHPCFKTGLKSYIGVPIQVDDKLYGTLNFSSPNPKDAPFLEIDMEFIEILSEWVGNILSRIRMLEELHILATYDGLTGLPNRNTFIKKLEKCIQRSNQGDKYNFALLFIDLDQFKQVNDTYGHDSGDLLLKKVSKRLENAIRPKDTVGRFAGDEFVILLEDVKENYALEIAERILKELDESIQLEGIELLIGASIGIAMSKETDTPEHIIRKADAAMYRAKRGKESIYKI